MSRGNDEPVVVDGATARVFVSPRAYAGRLQGNEERELVGRGFRSADDLDTVGRHFGPG